MGFGTFNHFDSFIISVENFYGKCEKFILSGPIILKLFYFKNQETRKEFLFVSDWAVSTNETRDSIHL